MNNVFNLSSQERYGYLIRKTADFETIYLIVDDEEQYVMIGSNGNNFLPVWPEKEFAQLFLADDWVNCIIEEMSIYNFMEWLDDLSNDNIEIAGFPDLDLNTVCVSANEMKNHLEFELSQYE